MFWAGLVSFLILIVMEAVVLFFRRIFAIPEPAFQLILDRDILIDHEIDDTYSFDFVAANALMLRMGKERAMPMAAIGNSFHEHVMNPVGVPIVAIGELPGTERVVASDGEEMSVNEGVEDDLESEATSR